MGKTAENSDLTPPRADLTPQQAEDIVKWVVAETYAVFQRRGERWPGWAPTVAGEAFNAAVTSPLTGYCGDAQSFINLTLQGYGMDSRAYAMQNVPDFYFGHVGLTSTFETTEGPKTYLIDPTFRQFMERGEKDKRDPPGMVMAALEGGKELLEALTTKGYAELTPARAAVYIASFNQGVPLHKSEAESMNFFLNPQPHKASLYFTREQLRERGMEYQP